MKSWTLVNTSQRTSLFKAFEVSVALLFQEFNTERSSCHKSGLSTAVRFMWVVTTMFIVMGFSGNLKSSFIRQNYEDRTMTLNGMVDKDMTIHTSTELEEYLELTKSISEINSRLLCQAHKKDSVFVTG